MGVPFWHAREGSEALQRMKEEKTEYNVLYGEPVVKTVRVMARGYFDAIRVANDGRHRPSMVRASHAVPVLDPRPPVVGRNENDKKVRRDSGKMADEELDFAKMTPQQRMQWRVKWAEKNHGTDAKLTKHLRAQLESLNWWLKYPGRPSLFA